MYNIFTKKGRWFSLQLLSYIVILVLSMAIGSIIFSRIDKIMEQQSIGLNNAVLEQLKQSMDLQIKEIQSLANQIALDKRVKSFTNAKTSLDSSDRFAIYEIISNFSTYKWDKYLIDDFGVYFTGSDVLITSTSLHKPEEVYKNLYTYNEKEYKDWHENILSGYFPGKFLTAKMKKVGFNSTPVITYVQSLSYSVNGRPIANIIIFLDEIKILKLLSKIKDEHADMNILIYADDKLLVSTDKSIIEPETIKEMEQSRLLKVKNSGNKSYVVSKAASQYSGWKYVTISPLEVILGEVNKIKVSTVLFAIGYLLIGMIISYYMAYKNYNPLGKIINIIRTYSDEVLCRDELSVFYHSHLEGKKRVYASNEIIFLEETLSSVINRDRQVVTSLRKQWPMLKNNLLNSLVKEEVKEDDSIMESLNVYDVTFPFQCFAVTILNMDRETRDTENERGLTSTEIIPFISNMVDGLNSLNQCQGYVFSVDKYTIVIIVNMKNYNSFPDYQQKLIKKIEEVKNQIYNLNPVIITACLGNIHYGIEGIRLSYQEAVQSLDYRIIKGRDAIICYTDICNTVDNYYYPIDIETQLINCVKAGNISDATALLDKIFIENFRKRNLAIKRVRCLFFDIMSTAIKTLESISMDYKEIFTGTSDPVDDLVKCQTVGEIYDAIKQIYDKICEYIKANKKSHYDIIKSRIVQYLDKHYLDQDLNQIMLADALNISPGYLSGLFKELFGDKMVSYISKMRVEKAKVLLLDDSLTIGEVAHMVGCSNDMSLTRIFKKHENITPGVYREMTLQLQNRHL